ncbi:MAG: DUF2273 domain-containing protein [bacterium]|jgi:uncharacterized membrane protein
MTEELLRLLLENRGKIVGVLLGFVMGWFLISKGLVATLIIMLFVLGGYYFGCRFDAGSDWRDLFNRFFPPY